MLKIPKKSSLKSFKICWLFYKKFPNWVFPQNTLKTFPQTDAEVNIFIIFVNVLLTQKHIKQVMSFPLKTHPKFVRSNLNHIISSENQFCLTVLVFTQAH